MAIYQLKFARVFTYKFHQAFEFYSQTLGLKVLEKNDKIAYALFDTGAAKLILEEKISSELIGRYTGLSLTVQDIEATFNQLGNKGVIFRGYPAKQYWGGYLVDFEDYDGNILTLSG
ncbi:MAG: VOC family protein [Pseudomonadales bacterium]|nr:VOC family protein [Pseudomonadales bacterium]